MYINMCLLYFFEIYRQIESIQCASATARVFTLFSIMLNVYINRPILLEGCLDDWEAFKKWVKDYLTELCGDVSFSVGPVSFYVYILYFVSV